MKNADVQLLTFCCALERNWNLKKKKKKSHKIYRKVSGVLPSRKRPGGVGQHSVWHAPAVCPGGREGQWHPGPYQQ